MLLISVLVCAISLYGVSGDEVTEQLSLYPQWPEKCSFKKYVGKSPNARSHTTTTTTTETECERQCAGDVKCGIYRWHTLGVPNSCWRLQHSVSLWEDAGLPVDEMLENNSHWNTGSKECKALTIINECNYNYTNLTRPTSHHITDFYTKSLSLKPQMCTSLCSLYPDCLSVWYLVSYDGWAVCRIYGTHGKEECTSTIHEICGTYTRHCSQSITVTTAITGTSTATTPTTTSSTSTSSTKPTSTSSTKPTSSSTTKSISTSTKPRTKTADLDTMLYTVAIVVAVIVLLAVAEFAAVGHWIYNKVRASSNLRRDEDYPSYINTSPTAAGSKTIWSERCQPTSVASKTHDEVRQGKTPEQPRKALDQPLHIDDKIE